VDERGQPSKERAYQPRRMRSLAPLVMRSCGCGSSIYEMTWPDRRSGEPSCHLRQRGHLILLHRSEHLRVDVWQMRSGLLAAEAAHVSGDRSVRLAAL